MARQLLYISKGKMYITVGEKTRPVDSGVLARYLERVKTSARRNAWKTGGEGAKFTGTFDPEGSASDRVASVSARVSSMAYAEGALYYALTVGGASGIYRKRSMTDEEEGTVLSDGDYLYGEMDIHRDRVVYTAAFAGEAHLGICDLSGGNARMITEGESIESSPVWSKTEPDVIYYSSAGLAQMDAEALSEERMQSLPALLLAMAEAGRAVELGPAGIYRLDLAQGEITEIAEDPRYNYVKPQVAEDGSLYYIRRPYTEAKGTARGSCLLDLLLLPVHLLRALFGFLTIFTMKYSGTTLRSGGSAAKKKSEADLYIEGNLINAAESLRQNGGEDYPGIIPRSWELIRRTPDGREEVVRRGVLSFCLDGEGFYFSNGSYVLYHSPDGKEEKITKADEVTFIGI